MRSLLDFQILNQISPKEMIRVNVNDYLESMNE
jgi:hypothetical protein